MPRRLIPHALVAVVLLGLVASASVRTTPRAIAQAATPAATAGHPVVGA
jgi:hypothetical protein